MTKNKGFEMSMRDFHNEQKKWFLDKPEDTLAKLLNNRHGIFYTLMNGDRYDDDFDGFNDLNFYDFDGPCPCCGCDCHTKQNKGSKETLPSAKEMLENNLKNILTAIENGADVNQKLENTGTPLHWTTWQHNSIPGTLEIIQKLIQHGANVNALNSRGQTPLNGICENYKKSDVNVVKILVDAGCDVNTGNPLVTAADRDNVELVKYLISVGADVNQKDSRGNNSLSKAIKGKNYGSYLDKYNAIVKVLVEAGADLTATNEYGRDAYYLANSCKNKEIIEYLESKKILNVSDNDLYKMITTDFEFDFFGDRVKVITDYEKVDKDKKIVQLVKLVEPKKSFGVHCKWDIVNHLKNN